jgi:hypothetical protein
MEIEFLPPTDIMNIISTISRLHQQCPENPQNSFVSKTLQNEEWRPASRFALRHVLGVVFFLR